MNKTEANRLMIEIFTLIVIGQPGAKLEAAELIRKLDATAPRDLRAACQTLDLHVENVWMDEMRERRRRKLTS